MSFNINVGYAAMQLPDSPLLHSILIKPTYTFGKESRQMDVFTGVQMLRGGHGNQNLATVGVAFRF
ncbi:MAG: hypothetical protein M3R15_35085 [Acidobacteriota bacterium]|nr:hypothetical protein [Acidobacteriota bacterium]